MVSLLPLKLKTPVRSDKSTILHPDSICSRVIVSPHLPITIDFKEIRNKKKKRETRKKKKKEKKF